MHCARLSHSPHADSAPLVGAARGSAQRPKPCTAVISIDRRILESERSENQRIRIREESENQRISRIREPHACILRVCSKKISGGLILHASGTVHCTGLRIPRGLQLYSYHARTAVVAHLRLHGGGGSPHAACRMRCLLYTSPSPRDA